MEEAVMGPYVGPKEVKRPVKRVELESVSAKASAVPAVAVLENDTDDMTDTLPPKMDTMDTSVVSTAAAVAISAVNVERNVASNELLENAVMSRADKVIEEVITWAVVETEGGGEGTGVEVGEE
eukprot:gene4660-5704_t